MSTLGVLTFAEPGERPLAAALRQGNDHQLVRLLGSPADDATLVVEEVVDVLKGPVSDQARNAAALALVDLHAAQASDALVEVISRPDLAQSAGTLVYALNELGGMLPLSTLILLLTRGSFEARAESLTLLECGRVRVRSAADRDAARRELLRLARSPDVDMAGHAALALEWLPEVEAGSR